MGGRIFRQAAHRVHAVVSADIKEAVDLIFFEDRIHFFDGLFVADLFAARTERGGGSVGKKGERGIVGRRKIRLQIDNLFVQKALHTVFHAVNFGKALGKTAGNNARKRRVDRAGRTARLTDDGSFLLCHARSFLVFAHYASSLKRRTASFTSSARKIAEPATSTFAPASTARYAFSGVMPPST